MRVRVVDVAPTEHLEMSDHVDDREQKQQEARHGHHVLRPDRGAQIPSEPGHVAWMQSRTRSHHNGCTLVEMFRGLWLLTVIGCGRIGFDPSGDTPVTLQDA